MQTPPQTEPVVALPKLAFADRFSTSLPADPSTVNQPRQVTEAAFSYVTPAPAPEPSLLAVSSETLDMLGLTESDAASPGFAQMFSGNAVAPGTRPYAMNYGGHQFGNWAGQLGDGRAINLGEVKTPSGEHLVLQLKGAGRTPYSRGADGRAVLRSSLREFVCSEAMHHLGVATTRALSLVSTGEPVLRDMLYNGNAAHEPGAVVCRVSSSFLRFGSFQIHAARRDPDTLRKLLQFTIKHHYPECAAAEASDSDAIASFFKTLCERTAKMVVDWQRVGFVHGVMNTDNMSVLGETIDYGPYGWLEDYNPDWTPNTTDAEFRRYRFGQQPAIALWNLGQLANTLHTLTEDAAPLQDGIDHYRATFETAWREMMVRKLGLSQWRSGDEELTDSLDALLKATETDMTLFYRALIDLPLDTHSEETLEGVFQDAWYTPESLTEEYRSQLTNWVKHYRDRTAGDSLNSEARAKTMQAANPLYVPRNYLAQLAIDAAEQGDLAPLRRWTETLKQPYQFQPGCGDLAAKRPEWARSRAGCSMLSCSS